MCRAYGTLSKPEVLSNGLKSVVIKNSSSPRLFKRQLYLMILDKIFQPFYTTKPTGQGTGLGLSLSYDIIKALSGELKVETKEGEGIAFIILLPA